ncbi:DUF418 domain-containing protein [Sphingobium sp. CR2-8]|uniref:DUF418 domain-containing protein n=1 Tax=Sphingobium sp. CR2-8 TaxID=1306534 RepID=UPI002DB8A05C|nr:DUF418 domain-containing protein [Sphingobium sp. CR2-8]MEC3911769.1 DUF418 domain-containing protein [Sphingobium sp. CR2-8]
MTASPRIPAMDVLRGCAVLGILWMNITAFALPQNAYFNPAVAGPPSPADIAAWAVSLIFIDGKMRGLFALLFGASMLLLIDREEMAGRDGRRAQMIRSGWLFVIGCAHFLLLWWGDILRVYALVGLFALLFVGLEPFALVKRALLFFLAQFLLVAAFIASLYLWGHAAAAPGADLPLREGYATFMAALSDPASPTTQAEIATYRSGFGAIIQHKLVGLPGEWLWGFLFTAFETMGFMLLGMAMLKGGFLIGRWDAEQYRRTARHCFLIGVPPMAALALWVAWSGFAPLPAYGVALAWSLPFRIPLTVGWAALILWLVARHRTHPLVDRLAAAGRLALSNYLATSLVMTAIFYGWGLGLFAHLPPALLPLFVLGGWVMMLAWSKPYAARFAMGPVEWLWRSLIHGRPQKIRKSD